MVARALGYDHVVVIDNGCDRAAACTVSTDVAPDPIQATVDAKKTVELTTFRSSPASTFKPKVEVRRLIRAAGAPTAPRSPGRRASSLLDGRRTSPRDASAELRYTSRHAARPLVASPETFGAWVRLDDATLVAVDARLADRLGVPHGRAIGLATRPLELHVAVTARCPAACGGCYLDRAPMGTSRPSRRSRRGSRRPARPAFHHRVRRRRAAHPPRSRRHRRRGVPARARCR